MGQVELIAVGSELLRFGRRDTNTVWLTERLNRIGLEVAARSMVEDEPGIIASTLTAALDRSETVLVTGGIGPTEDDRTREAVASMLGVPLERDAGRVELLRAQFQRRGYPFLPMQQRQADLPRGAEWIDNPIGTAAGLRVDRGGHRLFVLPGVPAEMHAMFERSVLPLLRARGDLATRVIKVGGRSESAVDEQVRDLYERPGVAVTILGGREGIELHLRATDVGAAAARSILQQLEQEIRERLGLDVYGVDDTTLGSVVGGLLSTRTQTVATAESCTAGLLAARLTEQPGSSSWFRGGVVVYSDDLKVSLAGVALATIRQHGAVSEAVARELAAGARDRCAADHGVGITGIAGPGGGSAEKPVGRVHLAIAGVDGVVDWRLDLIGDRDLIRRRSVTSALDRLRRSLVAREGA